MIRSSGISASAYSPRHPYGTMLIIAFKTSAEYRVDCRNDEERHQGRKEQAADHRATQRCVLFRSLSNRQRHRQHAQHHRERSHHNRAQARRAGLNRRRDRIAPFLAQIIGEHDEQVAVSHSDADRTARLMPAALI